MGGKRGTTTGNFCLLSALPPAPTETSLTFRPGRLEVEGGEHAVEGGFQLLEGGFRGQRNEVDRFPDAAEHAREPEGAGLKPVVVKRKSSSLNSGPRDGTPVLISSVAGWRCRRKESNLQGLADSGL